MAFNTLKNWKYALLLGACVLSASAYAAHTPTGLEGHWSGTLPVGAEVTEAEITLDDYGCWAGTLKKIGGVDVGLYAVKDGQLELRTTEGLVVRTFVIGEDKHLYLVRDGVATKKGDACCSFYKD